MSRRVLAMAMAMLGLLAGPGLAQQYQGGYSAAVPAQTQIQPMNGQTGALTARTGCQQARNGAGKCGSAFEHQPQQQVRVTDYYCVDRFIHGGQSWANAMQACTRYQAQQSIGGYGQTMPDAAQRDVLDAQAGALDAFTRCLKSSPAGGRYCGPSL